ncbi:DUF6851 domain-containing protein [Streptomyces sp. SBT349]|uniref:DUF6851 domain-containing protein n=1 Tax=Streptomyces sp. SBT349 TaxID=1580539 RepID=UPI000A99BC05|nr:hypothetical protein [Streptomyces sp. SBT349]
MATGHTTGHGPQRRGVLLGMLGAAGTAGAGALGAVTPARAEARNGTATRPAVAPEDFDFDHGNAVRDLIYGGSDILEQPVAAMDVAIIIRFTHLSQTAWFDAIAPYHPTAVGIYSRLGRRPAGERETNRNRNIAILYAALRMFENILPQVVHERRDMMTRLGLDPDDRREDTETPVGLGNLAARGVIEHRERDGMNQLGDEGGRTHHPAPYADYLGYVPVNSAYELTDPSRWQPELGPHLRRHGDQWPSDFGAFIVQQFAAPQWRATTPYSFEDVNEFRCPPPVDSDHTDAEAYRAQVDDILARSAALTDEQKVMAETFDNKFTGIGRPVAAAAEHHGLDLDGWVHLCMTCSTATFDAGIAAWNEKSRHDSVRPFSAVRHVYGDRRVTAWGGPGRGTVDGIPGNQWRAYLKVGDHPEYPSGSTTLAAAQAHAARLFLDSDELGYRRTAAAGSSLVEPGITPAADLELRWDTWTDYVHDCGVSRTWGGVHFMSAVEASWDLGPRIGQVAYEFVWRHITGRAR